MTAHLPEAWFKAFDGEALAAKLSSSAVLATVDEQQWPHVSYLSAGEILWRGDRRLSLTLWPSSNSSINVERTGRAVLHASADGAVWETRLLLQRRSGLPAESLAIFDGEIEDVRKHAAPYAQVDAMIGFRLFAPEQTLARWEAQVEQMRHPGELAGAPGDRS